MTALTRSIPFNRPSLTGRELDYIRQAVEQGHASGDGPFTARCSALLRDITGVEHVLLTPSCTHALEMAGLLLDLGPGDEVIVPSFTFVSTANAFALRGARIVFADILPDTLNIDPDDVATLVSSRTRAIVPVHYAGVACDMTSIGRLATSIGAVVVEDNAHGLFGSYYDQSLGSFGSLATLSFHETKNITCGEGGALLINDTGLIERAEIIREKGTDRSRFTRGLVDKYTWVDIGSSYLLSDLLAAYLLAQLEQRDIIQTQRQRLWHDYHAGLSEWAATHGVRQPVVPAQCTQSYHMYYLLMPSSGARDRFLQHMHRHNILSVFHYIPLHSSPMGSAAAVGRSCPVTDDISGRIVRLPFYTDLNRADQTRVVDAIQQFVP
jgi:dTDP-4-amino-4,6-dideoxygalactose transaminase